MNGKGLNRSYRTHRPYGSYKSQHGFSYLFALFAIVLVGLSMMGANKLWITEMQREREAELLFRGHQYRRAIASYAESVPGARQYPTKVEDLLKDPRTSKRHLRTGYLDPITNGPFLAVQCPTLTDRFNGVVSSSDGLPLKHDNFPADYEVFRSAGSYRNWVFQYVPQPLPVGQQAQPGQVVAAPIPC
jgi:type II secretory pathway pseudopilin PulG